ncbi:MAG: DNA-directed polymerase, alpha subunit [Candidatus Saccharibacteria bacterium]|nr:DNA-directed polymerase, alpha subunit [Candidatus Saccharibacteria bacterium]
MKESEAEYLVGGAVLVTELFAKLVTEVKALGGSPEDIFALTKPNGRAAIRRMAQCVVPTPEELVQRQWNRTPIEELEVGTRAYNCLKWVGIQSIGDVVLRNENELMRIPNFGKACLAEVKQGLQEKGLKLAA